MQSLGSVEHRCFPGPKHCVQSVHKPVLLAQQRFDVVELWPLARILCPAALHQLAQLLTVYLGVDSGPQARPFAQGYAVNDLYEGT